MSAVKINIRRGDLEVEALLQIAAARIGRLDKYLIIARAELRKIKAAVERVKIDINPPEGLVRADIAAYFKAAAAQLVSGRKDLREPYRAGRGAHAAVLRRCVAQNGFVTRALAALDHVVDAVALYRVYRRSARALDDGDVLGKPVAGAVGLKSVDKQKIARLRRVFPRAPQTVLLKPFHAAEAAGEVRYNALGNARISRAPAYEHGAPRLSGQAVPCAVFRPVPTLFAVAQLRLGDGHEALALTAGRVGKRRRN